MHPLENDLDGYATLAVALADADNDAARHVLLNRYALDEDGWEALDDSWNRKLADDEQAFGHADGVPPLLAAYAQSFARAQAEQAGERLPFEQYARITRELSRGQEVKRVLKRHKVTLYTYLQSHHQWTLKLASDTKLAARLRKLLA